MGIEEKLDKVSQLLEKFLHQFTSNSQINKSKHESAAYRQSEALMKQFIDSAESLRCLNSQIIKNTQPYFMGKVEVIKLTGLSASTLWRMEKKGDFPVRRRVGINSTKWVSTEVLEWITTREKIF